MRQVYLEAQQGRRKFAIENTRVKDVVGRREYLISRDYISLPGEDGLIPRLSWNSREKMPAMGGFSRTNRTGATTGTGLTERRAESRDISLGITPLIGHRRRISGSARGRVPRPVPAPVYEYLAFSLVSSTGYGPTDGPGYHTTCAISRQVSTARFRVVYRR